MNSKSISEGDFSINPTPQEMKVSNKVLSFTSTVGIVVGENTDEHAISVVTEALKSAGVDDIIHQKAGGKLNPEVNIWIGGPSENESSADVLVQIGVNGPAALDKESYVLASLQEQQKIVLAGSDKTGTYYAAQTFKQIIQNQTATHSFPEIEIRDWPDMPIRGSIEGFYGPPWSHQDRLNQLDFYGDNKFNTYIYAPKDDPYHREDWRKPYPENELDRIKELITKAKENHVNFTFSLSPGLDVSYSGDEDYDFLERKMKVMWDLGVRSFALFLDDIDKVFHSERDKEKFKDDHDPIAAAHAYLLNRFNEEFIKKHDGAERLITVPTDYSGGGTNVYRETFARLLNQDILVMWTGEKVVAEEITSEHTADIYDVFKHDILLWDNYPVNDHDRDNLFIAPLVNRDDDLTEHGVHGLTANPMNEAEASKLSMYTIADYTWNQKAYHPESSFERSLTSFAGDAAALLTAFAENSYSSPLSSAESLTLAPLIKSFWQAYTRNVGIERVAQELKSEFKHLRQIPDKLRNQLHNEKFLQEIDLYLNKLEVYAEAGEVAVDYLLAQKDHHVEKANNYRTSLVELFNRAEAIPKKMGQGVIAPFLIESALIVPPLEFTLQPSIEAFKQEKEQTAEKLIIDFKKMQEYANMTRDMFDDNIFSETIDPYLQNLTIYGEAGEIAVHYTIAKENKQHEKADEFKEQLRSLMIKAYKVPQKIGNKVVKPFLIDTFWDELNVTGYRELDGVNTSRGGGVFIQYTPKYGDSTNTNHWGYEVIVENGIVVKRGGNDSEISENSYVLSIHGSDWLRDHTAIGAQVHIDNNIVLIIDSAKIE